MKMKQFYKCCSGVIMMETILVLPIYIVLLFGVFWLGESCLARLVLTNGESLRLWENSSRHRLTQILERDIFWEFPVISDSIAVSGTGSFNFSRTADANTRWGQMVVGRAAGILRRSVWSHAADSSAKYLWGISPAENNDEPMVARGTVEDPLNAHLLSRRNYAGRSDIYSSLSRAGDGDVWETEYISPWRLPRDDDNSKNFDVVPESGLKTGETISSIGPYNGGSRNDNYVAWSQ